jgi:hypothetical protein
MLWTGSQKTSEIPEQSRETPPLRRRALVDSIQMA